MERQYNSMAFTPEEVKKGLHLKLIKFLVDLNKKLEDCYNDIHIGSDGYCTIIEWTDVNFNYDSAKFQFVPEDGYIMYDRQFPDGHYEFCADDDDYNFRLEEFLKDNPGWVKTEYGTWTNEIENKKFQEMLEKEKENDK